MVIQPEDLLVLSGGGGERFEAFVRDLVRAECRVHGIPPTETDWDYRVNCPDGGCDIFVRQPHSDPNPAFVPNEPSVWCIKSGADGIKSQTLRDEVESSSHCGLRKHLSDGHKYVWCALQPISQPKREKMREQAEKLAKEYKFHASQIVFVWIETLQEVLGFHANLVSRHLPGIAHRLRGVRSLDEYLRESRDSEGFAVQWVGFAERDALKQRIRKHLLDTEGSPVLHIAGLSGVGKTRTAIEACLDDEQLCDTLYAPDLAGISREFLQYMESAGTNIRLIIDEVPLPEYEPLVYRFRGLAKRVRIVTIGPAKRGERTRTSNPYLVILGEPNSTDGTLSVVRKAGADLPSDVQKSIADVSGHDLRLALLLVFATVKNPDLRTIPVRNHDDVWDRVTKLFTDQLGDITSFTNRYQILTSAVDVGHNDKYRSEIEYLAKHFATTSTDLDRTVRDAHECGLGFKTHRFFEAGPRTLAVWMFQDKLWPVLSSTIEQFLDKMPSDRLLRRFIERCQEVQGIQRDDVLNRVGAFFLTYLGVPKIDRLGDREKSRVFQSWAEADPQRGLGWLRKALDSATDEDLCLFCGEPDGSGGWGGRRQIVWLCEHLACFADFFWDCESILFRLAQVETEKSIGNNSLNTWKEMFLPILSNTEVPFPQRFECLISRLRQATECTLDLVLSAAVGVLETHITRQAPPTVVGGRVVPDEWSPKTVAELHTLQQEAARSILKCVDSYEAPLRHKACAGLIQELFRFVDAGAIPKFRETMRLVESDYPLLRKLRATLDDTIYREELVAKERGEPAPVFIEELRSWRNEIEPANLTEQILDLTARYPWSARRLPGGRMSEDTTEVYLPIALAALKQPEILKELEDWFGSEACVSCRLFALQLGKVDEGLVFMPLALKWLRSGKAIEFSVGYLSAVSTKLEKLPNDAVKVLDRAAETHPLLAVKVTIHADITSAGFDRLMACVGSLTSEERGVLRPLAHGRWRSFLQNGQKDALLAQLEGLTISGDANALAIAFDLLVGWTEHGKVELNKESASMALRLLRMASEPDRFVDDYLWKIVVQALMSVYPSGVAEVLADTITDVKSHRFNRSKYAESLFRQLAESHPNVCMSAIGRWVIDDERGPIFRIWRFKGLFDSIGLDTVRPWVRKHGMKAAIGIARNLEGPHINENGKPIVPQLADWLLTEFAENKGVFWEFCIGRHSGEVRVGRARDRRGEIERLTEPFANDKRKWIRDWVDYELASLREEIEYDDKWEDERNRT